MRVCAHTRKSFEQGSDTDMWVDRFPWPPNGSRRDGAHWRLLAGDVEGLGGSCGCGEGGRGCGGGGVSQVKVGGVGD